MSTANQSDKNFYPNRRLAWFAERTGMSQTEMAEHLGLSRPYLSAIFNERASVSRKTLRAFQAAFGLLPQWVMSGTGPYCMGEDEPLYLTLDVEGAPADHGLVPVIAREAFHCGRCHRELTQYAMNCHNCGALLDWTPVLGAEEDHEWPGMS